ncbi:nickel pincer cofactor biosynthesis protein LarC [Pseudonocardia dioxanivorans]|nr:LarC family nickel insertion protein [Pseudonocardia dioxanivorans]
MRRDRDGQGVERRGVPLPADRPARLLSATGRGAATAGTGRVGWFDCAAGAAGDMLLAALVDAGADLDVVAEHVGRLGVEPMTLRRTLVERHAIGAVKIDVLAPADAEHRTWKGVRALLDAADLPGPVAALAHDAFARLAAAEGRVHRIDPQDVHFHEVGALDALADVVGVASALHLLELDELHASPVALGSGTSRGSHGLIPVPAPATLEILRAAQAPCYAGPSPREMCTPTGAALLAAAVTTWGQLPRMVPRAIGVGAGSRDLAEVPNVVRLVVGDRA